MGAHGHPKKLWGTTFHNPGLIHSMILELWTDDDIRNCLFIKSGILGHEACSMTPGIELADIVELRDALTHWIHERRRQERLHDKRTRERLRR